MKITCSGLGRSRVEFERHRLLLLVEAGRVEDEVFHVVAPADLKTQSDQAF